MNSIAMNLTKPNLDKNAGTLLILAVVSVFILAIRWSGNDIIPTSSREPFTIQSDETIWPAVGSKNLLSKEVEYRPSPNPQAQNAYCVYRYSDDVEVHQFIGQASHNHISQLDCPNT